MSEKLISALASVCGPEHILNENVSERYSHDWSAEAAHVPACVIRPGSTNEVSRVLALCHEHHQPVVVQGGLTGLCGGGNPQPGEFALSLERLVGIEELDEKSMTMTVLAGTPLESIQLAAEDAGFIFPLDLGARGTCNIGGNISTNAGGNQVLRFGMTRALVLGLEAVMADGKIISSLNKMLKNNAGYDLKQLFIGTEGTLGIVTRAVLRLFPKPVSRCSALLAVESFDQVTATLSHLGSSFGAELSSFEVMWASYFNFIIDHVESTDTPFDSRYPLYILMELEGSNIEGDAQKFQQALEEILEQGAIVDAVIASSEREREALWKIRDGVGDIGPFLRSSANFDISVPISVMPEFLEELQKEIDAEFPQSEVLVFGHIADSNLHIVASATSKTEVRAIYSLVYRVTGSFNGSVSAEHGVGVQKKAFLHYSRTPEELALMKLLKTSLDPRGILNPGRVVD